MARTLYNLLLCATLALIATLWMRPGLAQDILDLARNVRFQSPGVAAASPQATDFSTPPGWNGQASTIPYSNLPSGPVQPLPATRPASWPGAPLETSTLAATNSFQQSAVPTAQPMNGYAPQTGYEPQSGYAPSTAYAPPTGYSPPPATPANNPYAYPSSTTAFLSSPAGASPTQDSPSGPALAPPQNTVQLPPQNSVQPPPQNGMAMVSQTNADMQSLQVLPGPRKEYEDGKIVATVGTIPILAGDVRAMLNQRIRKNNSSKMPSPEEQQAIFAMYMRPMLKSMIETKLIVNDAKQSIPAAAFPKIEADINHDFDKAQIPKLMELYKVDSQHELDEALRQAGSSLDWERRSFIEDNIFKGWLNQQVKEQQQVPLADVLGYYEQHIADYEFPAQAKWEELMVSFEQFPDKASAYAALAQMGNQVMQGVPFAEVAKKSSQGLTADKGGAYDWTTQGSLAAKALDENLFKLPVGSLSPILESDRGFHIIRVVERKNAGRKSFEDTQGDIKKQLKEEDRKKQLEKYLDELHKKTPVHTMFDDQPGGLDGPPKEEEHHF